MILERFFFRSIDVRQLALLRIGIGSLIVVYLIQLMPLFRVHFAPEGWLGSIRDLDLYHAGSWSILFSTGTESQAWGFFGVVLFCAAGFTIGLLTRFSGFAAFVGLVSLWNRNPLLMDGDDAILRVMLFYLLLSPCGNAFSLDNLLRRRTQQVAIWPLRMMQIQLALVYFISGWVKFHSPEWLEGTVLQTVLIHPEYSRWNWSDSMHNPIFLKGLEVVSDIVMWWEILFPVLISCRFTRNAAIATGLAFHGGLLVFMHLRLFSVIMLVLYIAWLPSGYFRPPITQAN